MVAVEVGEQEQEAQEEEGKGLTPRSPEQQELLVLRGPRPHLPPLAPAEKAMRTQMTGRRIISLAVTVVASSLSVGDAEGREEVEAGEAGDRAVRLADTVRVASAEAHRHPHSARSEKHRRPLEQVKALGAAVAVGPARASLAASSLAASWLATSAGVTSRATPCQRTTPTRPATRKTSRATPTWAEHIWRETIWTKDVA